jgi:hypothetical protein
MQKTAEVAHLPSAAQAPPPEQSLAVVHAHCPESASQAADAQSALVVHRGESAQFPDCGGYAAESPVLRCSIQIGNAQALLNV